MGEIIKILADILVLAGTCVLIASLFPVRRLIKQLPSGRLRRRWMTLTGMIVLFIAGYASYGMTFWERHIIWSGMIVSSVFFIGALFVWSTATLSLHTAMDIRRVTLLEHENITDPLIGIYNRRYLDRRLEEEFLRARRYHQPLSVLLLDIDHFKDINDTHGHQVGDIVLNRLGALILQAKREPDIVARYGGDELLILAPNTEVSSAEAFAERLRREVEAHQPASVMKEPEVLQALRITVSIGAAGLEPDVSEWQWLLRRADEALCRAKQEGRNRVVCHGRFHSDSGNAEPAVPVKDAAPDRMK